MKNIIIEKQTINWERKNYYKRQDGKTAVQRVVNKKKSERYGYYADNSMEKYGVMQALIRSENYDRDELIA